MAKMTKAQCKKRLMEALNKCTKVKFDGPFPPVLSTPDLLAIEKIIMKAVNRLK
jgi:hypothetical protein